MARSSVGACQWVYRLEAHVILVICSYHGIMIPIDQPQLLFCFVTSTQEWGFGLVDTPYLCDIADLLRSMRALLSKLKPVEESLYLFTPNSGFAKACLVMGEYPFPYRLLDFT